MKDIYTMKLHEKIHIDKFLSVARVPGGWLYTTYPYLDSGCCMSTVFVPWHDSGRQIASNGNYEELSEKLKKSKDNVLRLGKKLLTAEGCIDSIQSDIQGDGGSVSWLCKQYYGENH